MNIVKPEVELADIFNLIKSELKLPKEHWKVVNDITNCRTNALGGHLFNCTDCKKIQPQYNSCRNRHCPKCQGSQTAKWLEARSKELLNTPYFHIVFTIPHELNSLILNNKAELFNIMFKAVNKTLKTVGKTKLGGKIGYFAILHTWGQKLNFHPHIHCVVPGVVIKKDDQVEKTSKKFFLPVKVLQRIFRAVFMKLVKKKIAKPLSSLLYSKEWIVYAKKPFKSPTIVLKYLANYTHKIAISNHRIKSIENNKVTFSYKDYSKKGKKKLLSLDLKEFTRRFLLHVNPKQFVRIRHFGFLAPSNRAKAIALIQKVTNTKEISLTSNQTSQPKCMFCKSTKLQVLGVLKPLLALIPHRNCKKSAIPPPVTLRGSCSTRG